MVEPSLNATTSMPATTPDYLHCKLQIARVGWEYGLRQEFVHSTLQLLLPQAEGKFFSLGGGASDYLQINNLPDDACSFSFLDDNLILQVQSAVEVVVAGQRHKLRPNQKVRCFGMHTDQEPFQWAMLLANQTSIMGKVWQEECVLPTKSRLFLESQHGTLTKLQEGKSCLIFKTSDGRVIKMLRPTYTANAKVLARFIHAARQFQKLPRHLFPAVHDIGYLPEEELCYVVLDYLEGETLENQIARRGVMTCAEAVAIVKQLAQRLQVLQDLGSAYRNLNPANIVIAQDGRIGFTGFFLLKSDIGLTQDGAQMVIPGYTAPEQIYRPASADIAADMFSLGAILHTLLIGEPPWNLATIKKYVELLRSAPQVTAQSIVKIAPAVPVALCELMADLLSLEKSDRPTPREVLERLAALDHAEPQPETPPMAPQAQPATSAIVLDASDTDRSTPDELAGESHLSQSMLLLLDKIDKLAEVSAKEDSLGEMRVLELEHLTPDDEDEWADLKPALPPVTYRTPARGIPLQIPGTPILHDNCPAPVAERSADVGAAKAKFQEAYRDCETRQRPITRSVKTPTRPFQAQSAIKQPVRTIVPATPWTTACGCLIVCLAIVWGGTAIFHRLVAPNRRATEPTPAANNTKPDSKTPQIGPDAQHGKTDDPTIATRPPQPEQVAVVTLGGRISELHRYGDELQYCVLTTADKAWAVVPDPAVRHQVAELVAAAGSGAEVEVVGIEATLPPGQGFLLVKGQRTRVYLKITKVRTL